MIARAERRLKNLGFFKTVKITDEPGSAPDRIVLNVALEEQDTGDFNIMGGYSTTDGILGEVTPERVTTLQAADAIFVEELRAANLYRECAQALAVLTPLRTVGVMGDYRNYSNVVALRAVTTDDFMTADWARLPYDFLAKVSSRIVNEVPGVNRVVYDISTKPPSTIEWE